MCVMCVNFNQKVKNITRFCTEFASCIIAHLEKKKQSVAKLETEKVYSLESIDFLYTQKLKSGLMISPNKNGLSVTPHL
jgi:hypothetical protein